MYKRIILSEIKELAKKFQVVTVLGPRQAGKTTLCQLAFPDYRYVSLEDPDMRSYAENDPRGFLADYPRQVIFDEVQRVPALLSYLQGIVDKDKVPGQFILTGSHQLELGAAISQSLAGRTTVLTLLPLAFAELYQNRETVPALDSVLLQGFMPGKHADNIEAAQFYRAYFRTYVERDVRLLINLKDFSKFERFIQICAGRIGQLLNQSSLANDVGVSVTTIGDWLSILEASYIIFRLQPFHENFGKRLIKSGKLYFLDVGLATWLLGIESENQLRRDPLRGNLVENMVVVETLKNLFNRGKDPRLYFFRDSRGNEIDLLIQKGRELETIEIKAAQTWHNDFLKGINYFNGVVKGYHTSSTVVYGGAEERNASNYRLLPYSEVGRLGVD